MTPINNCLKLREKLEEGELKYGENYGRVGFIARVADKRFRVAESKFGGGKKY